MEDDLGEGRGVKIYQNLDDLFLDQPLIDFYSMGHISTFEELVYIGNAL